METVFSNVILRLCQINWKGEDGIISHAVLKVEEVYTLNWTPFRLVNMNDLS